MSPHPPQVELHPPCPHMPHPSHVQLAPPSCHTHSPISSKDIGDGQISTHDDVINQDPLGHGPKFKPHSRNRTEAGKEVIVLKVTRIINRSWSPFALNVDHHNHTGCREHTTHIVAWVVDHRSLPFPLVFRVGYHRAIPLPTADLFADRVGCRERHRSRKWIASF